MRCNVFQKVPQSPLERQCRNVTFAINISACAVYDANMPLVDVYSAAPDLSIATLAVGDKSCEVDMQLRQQLSETRINVIIYGELETFLVNFILLVCFT